MKESMKLSNYLFGWFMKEKGIGIMILSLVFGLGSIIQTLQRGSLARRTLEEFYSYDMVIDGTLVSLCFCVGLLLLLVFLFIQANGFYTKSKGMYTILTLPMQGRDIFFAFFVEALAVISLYFALWMAFMVLCYFPVTAFQAKAVAELSFQNTAGQMVTGIEAGVQNGLYLAFQRSYFLSSCFPVTSVQGFTLLGGLCLSLVTLTFAGIYNENAWVRMGLCCVGVFGLYVAMGGVLRPWFVPGARSMYPTRDGLLLAVTAWFLGGLLTVVAVKCFGKRRDL